MRSHELSVTTLTLAALCGLGCETREIGVGHGRQLVFSEDFERDELGADWSRGEGEGGQGSWRIEDGWLVGQDIKNDPLWWTGKLPDKARVEFDAQAMSEVGDLKVEIFGDGVHHESGYIVIFGGWGNSLDVIARLDEHGADRRAQRTRGVIPNKTYRWALERSDGELRWYLDDELVMAYPDERPLRGTGHRGFAFNDWAAPVRFDNVVVYRLD